MVPAVLFTALAAGSAQAAIICTADEQCRGDAMRMCAPSALSVQIERRATGHIGLWIDHQGPYEATSRREGESTRYTLEAFGAYTLDIAQDGAFLYRGNRGKRYRGHCKGELQ